jgi:hypothetical protein
MQIPWKGILQLMLKLIDPMCVLVCLNLLHVQCSTADARNQKT